MKMLELFSGSGKLSQRFKDGGWETTSLDILNGWDAFKDEWPDLSQYDFIWSGTCCRTYSLAGARIHRYRGGLPKSEDAAKWDELNTKQFKLLLESGKPFIVENPRGFMNKMEFVKDVPYIYIYTVNYCCFGDKVKKPTNLFTNINLDEYFGNYKYSCGCKTVSFEDKVKHKERSLYSDGFVEKIFKIIVERVK